MKDGKKIISYNSRYPSVGDLKKKASSKISNNSKEGGFQILRLLNTECVTCRISKISFFINDFTEQSKKIRLRVYSYDDEKQEPKDELLTKSIIINPSKKNEWIDVIIDDNLITKAPMLLVGVEFLYNDDKVSLGLTDSISECQTFIKSVGGFWYKPEFMKNKKGNFFNLMVKLELN